MEDGISEFSRLLIGCLMTKTQLAAALGLSRGRVYQWKEPPKYAVAFMKIYKQNLALREEVATLRDTMQRIKEHV